MLHWFAERLREIQGVNRDERGFTLIELGILAAIAIPTFLAQRQRAHNAAAQSDLRNAAAASQTCAVAKGDSYSAYYTEADLKPYGFNPTDGVTYTPGTANANYLEAEAKWGASGQVYSFTSDSADDDAGKVVAKALD